MKIFFAILFQLFSVLIYAQEMKPYNQLGKIEGVKYNDDFTVKVRIVNGEWEELPVYMVPVDEVQGTGHHVERASMCYFDFFGKVEVAITYNKGEVNSARIRPLSYKISNKIEENTVTFKLSEPRNLSIEVNGDIFHNLHLFANPVDNFKLDKNDQNVLFFAPGVHYFEDNQLLIPSGKTVYISGGAVLMGQLLIHDAHNVKVLGSGMIDQSVKMGIHIANSKNVKVEGVFCTQCAVGGSDSVTIKNVKSISYFGWGDGMNVFASNNVLYDRVFCRNSDDCHTVYATRKGFSGGSKNITMQNSTLWADVAHPIMIGLHGNSEKHDVIENLTYRNIDILDHKEMQLDYQGCLTINAGDNNLVKNVLFEDIRVENFRQGQLINLRIFYNQKYCTAPGLGIENVHFKNVEYNGDKAEISMISGYNDERQVKNISFENLKINGELIYDQMDSKPYWFKTSDMAHIFVGEHTEGVEFINTTEDSIELDVELLLNQCVTKVHQTLESLDGYEAYPRNILKGETTWNTVGIHDWCSGFWPGILWYAYEASGEKDLLKEAEKFTAPLEGILNVPVDNHDLGFMLYCSAGNGIRLTNNAHYHDLLLRTADSLATLYNPKVGTILSWPAMRTQMNWPHNTIIDNMMNLELLFWAAKNGGDQYLYDMAVRHAQTCMHTLVRPDSTIFHVAVFDTIDGHFIKGVTHQGYADHSMWARGQAWGIYGYTMVYRETGDLQFLEMATKLADKFIHRLPKDGIPYWDFDDPTIPNSPKDASAAAVAASAMIELASLMKEDEQKEKYANAALSLLKKLSSKTYMAAAESNAFLKHSTGHKPHGSEIDASIIYADYYYLEALLRLKKFQNL